ncbi:MAG: 16S rRNA (cytosine(967)-C(5))-methyltransferase RsmB [Clostridia bacterium]|nr:16S rRNA (cytosine(967)-C(5))-methyltransferase RsmB [Clostridia bacterium]
MKNKRPFNATSVALAALLRCETQGAYVALSSQSEAKALKDERDARLAIAIAHGVTEQKIRLDYILGVLLGRSGATLTPHTRNLLRIALYQLMFMERPAHAVVNEAVEMGEHRGEKSLLNAALRRAAADREALFALPAREKDELRYLSLAYAMPKDKVRIFVRNFGLERTESLLAAYGKRPPLCLRVNTVKTTREALLQAFTQVAIDALPSPLSPDGIRINGIANPTLLPGFDQGFFFVQDESSQLALRALAPKPNMRLLDACAGLGGKTFSAAALMDGRGEIFASDLHEGKIGVLGEQASRLGFENINFYCHDASSPFPEEWGTFDALICDVPCSGLGVIRRKPDLRHRPLDGQDELIALQKAILRCASEKLKAGGRLLYSTCTVTHEENRGNVDDFLISHPDFSLKEDRLLLPDTDGCDGFYFAVLQKNPT